MLSSKPLAVLKYSEPLKNKTSQRWILRTGRVSSHRATFILLSGWVDPVQVNLYASCCSLISSAKGDGAAWAQETQKGMSCHEFWHILTVGGNWIPRYHLSSQIVSVSRDDSSSTRWRSVQCSHGEFHHVGNRFSGSQFVAGFFLYNRWLWIYIRWIMIQWFQRFMITCQPQNVCNLRGQVVIHSMCILHICTARESMQLILGFYVST